MIINTEWGMFGTNGILDKIGLRTAEDRSLDNNSIKSGERLCVSISN